VETDREPAIACTLATSDDVAERVRDWQTVLARARSRERIEAGLRLHFAADPELAGELARLAALEVECCSWIDFRMDISSDATILEIGAPEAGMDVVMSLFGSHS
jgi:hypothetical protein